MKKLTVNEIFLSINGETTTMGLPTTFIRLAGCNLSCWNGCDTKHAIPHDACEEMTVNEIINRVNTLECSRVCVTGGEPLLNTESSLYLLQTLVENETAEISVETNGSIDLTPFKAKLGTQIRFIMDLKPPSSGMHEKMLYYNLSLLSENDELKLVIAGQDDFNWAVEKIKAFNPRAKILFSPLFGKVQPAHLVKWILEAKLWNSRIQLQLHKYIWSPETKGV